MTTTPPTAPRLYTVPQVAAMLNVSRGHIYNLMNQGELRWVKTGAARRVVADSVDEYLARIGATA